MGAYKGKASTIHEAEAKNDGFKKGGKAKKGCDKPKRATGGGVFSAAKSGTPRGASPKPY